MKLHIGKIIREQLEKKGMNKSEFARKLNTTPQNVYGIFKRQSIDTGLLQKISETLEINFFMLYFSDKPKAGIVREPAKLYGGNAEDAELKKKILLLESRNSELEKEIGYLKEIIALLKQKNKH